MGNFLAFLAYRPERAPGFRSATATHSVRSARGETVPVAYVAASPSTNGVGSDIVLLYFHGLSSDIDFAELSMLRYLRAWLRCGSYAVEYPGYPSTDTYPRCQPTDEAAYAAGLAAYDDLLQRVDGDASRILLYGKSMGSAVAAYVAAHRSGARALVLVSPVESVYRVAGDWLAAIAPADALETRRWIGEQSLPTLIVHGTDDRVAEPHHARHLHAVAERRPPPARTLPIAWVEDGAHIFEHEPLDGAPLPAFACVPAAIQRAGFII